MFVFRGVKNEWLKTSRLISSINSKARDGRFFVFRAISQGCRFTSSITTTPPSSSSSTSSTVSSRAHSRTRNGMVSLEQAKELREAQELDTVIVGFTDIYGRLMGKRFDARFFFEDCAKNGTHACDYLLACDMSHTPIKGFEHFNWEKGYGDFHLIPDMSTLRMASWLDKTAMIFCDVHDNRTHELLPFAPRSILRKQIAAANDLGYTALSATELEYYIYRDSYEEVSEKGFKNLNPSGTYLEDYHILHGTRGEVFNAKARKHLSLSGIPVETSKGEAGIGQHELNIKYSEILKMADRHMVFKQCLKEVAQQIGYSITFMAKPSTSDTGSGCHIHMSLWNIDKSKNVFVGDNSLGDVSGVSDLFRWFLGGWIQHTPELMVFYAPTVNSYKRFVANSWAPTRLAWSYDNRSAGFRVVGSENSLRLEMRIPGADINPYLAFSASLAAGLDGIKNKIEPPKGFTGNVYEAEQIPEVPKSLSESVKFFEDSLFAREAFGDEVVEHYAHFYQHEQNLYDRHVSDWERERYFEQI